MKFTPYLNFKFTCAEAFAFYEKLFGGKITFMMSHGDSPMAGDMPPEWHKAVMHATLDIKGQIIQGADAPGDWYQTPAGFAVIIELEDEAEADRIFTALVEGGYEKMAMAETFWAKRFGMCTDRFGTPWMINVPKPM